MAKVFVIGNLLIVMALFCSCANEKKLYSSDCNPGIKFIKVRFADLIDSARYYNKRYVEVSGKYLEGKNVSVLVSDSLMADHTDGRAFWVNFTQDCPLFLSGTQQGLFSSEDGSFAKLNDRQVTIRGRVETNLKGYRATLNEVSAIILY